MTLRIVFAGTPHFAIPSLKAIAESYDVCAVYTKPDSQSGRGLKFISSPVKQFVLEHYPDIPLLEPANLKDADNQKQLGEFFADVMIVIAYGHILPKAIFPLFKYGCINIHASLLPRWRGAAPIQRALLAGDAETGVTVMQINEGLDTGDILYQCPYDIKDTDTSGRVHDQLALLGAEALMKYLKELEKGNIHPKIQDNQFTTYADKINKNEALINWHQSVRHIDRQIRAFNPWPIAYTYLNGQPLRIWEAKILSEEITPHLAGRIIAQSEQGIDVATQQGVLRLITIQNPGGKPISIKDFLNARRDSIIPGETLLGEKIC